MGTLGREGIRGQQRKTLADKRVLKAGLWGGGQGVEENLTGKADTGRKDLPARV